MNLTAGEFLKRTAQRLRWILFSVPLWAVAGSVLVYALSGFFLVPAVVKWQIEKQVDEHLGHRIVVGTLRYNPFRFAAEAGAVTLSDSAGGRLAAFHRLFVDFEARSLIDRTWTFAAVRLERPALHVDIDQEGRLNFLPLFEALRGPDVAKEEAQLPRLLVRQLAVSGGRAEFTDRRLADPVITRATPVEFEFTDLSTLPSAESPYRLSARTAAGATARWSGALQLNPLGIEGRLAVNRLATATIGRALHEYISITAPAGHIDLAADFRLSYEAGLFSGGVERIELKAAGLSFSAPGGAAPLLALDAVTLTGARVDLARREVVVPEFTVRKGAVALHVDRAGSADWQKLMSGSVRAPAAKPAAGTEGDAPGTAWNILLESLEVADVAVSIADDSSGYGAQFAGVHGGLSGRIEVGAGSTRAALDRAKVSVAEARLSVGEDRIALPEAGFESAALSLVSAGRRAEIRVERPRASLAKIAVQQGANAIDSGAWSFGGDRLTVVSLPGKLDLAMEGPKLAADGVALKQGGDRMAVGNAAFDGKRLLLARDSGAQTLNIGAEAARFTLAGLALSRGEDSVHAEKASLAGQKVSVTQGGVDAEAALQGASVTLARFEVKTRNGKNSVLRVAGGRAAAQTVTVSWPATGAAVAADGVSSELSGVLIRDPGTTEELARIGRAQLAGGALSTRERTIAAESVLVADGGARIALDARGGINWARLAPEHVRPTVAKPKPAPAGGPDWRIAAKSTALRNFGVAYTDARYQPAAGVTLHGIAARLYGVDTGTAAAAVLDLRATVKEGGEVALSGRLDPRSGKSDLKVKVSALDLAPVQPYLREFVNLALTSGTLSAEGRLRYADPAAGARLVYEGAAVVDQLQIDEAEPSQPFVSWESMAADELTLAVGPNRLEILELRVTAPQGRLIIAEDQRANFSRIVRVKPDEPNTPAPRAAAEPEADPFPVSVARIRVERGVLEFADHSLRPQFGTRMHELKGVITGFATAPAARTNVLLDARVDQHGLAKIKGEINALAPQEHTDVDMTFRNLEMTALTPYIAKFAGYRIADGKLSVDLKYRIKEGLLVGDNRIVLEKLKLGEKVESPGAMDLPLELAIALLRDANGVIDVRLPVKGNLQDPQFDYGEIIGKAFGNLLGGIVTAPFRALAALFGGGSEDLDSIEFEPGDAALAPPERDKLGTVARALRNRPQLRLIIDPVFAPEDRSALQSTMVRREIVKSMGIELAPGDEPGPVDVANARAQRALEAMFTQRYSGSLLEHLKLRQAQKEPGLLHRTLLERLIREQPVAQTALHALAAQRGAAIVQELTTAGGVEPSRISLGEAKAATNSTGNGVTTQLALGAAP